MNKKKISIFFLSFLLVFGFFVPTMEVRAEEGIKIDELTFPDAIFRQFVLDNIDTDKDGVLEIRESSALTRLDVSDGSITSLKGVEYFTSLTYLECSFNQLTNLDVSKNEALIELVCSYNQLTSLDVSKNEALTELWCNDNQLTSLDVSKNEVLTELVCGYNQLTSLDVSKNEVLTDLVCACNQLTSLDVSKNEALTCLWPGGNELTNLDVSKNEALTDLMCGNNQLTSLDVSKNKALIYLECSGNQLTSLDVSKNEALTDLVCSGNQLTSLDVSKHEALTDLSCGGNQLTSLDVSKNEALTRLWCNDNQLTSLDVSKNEALAVLFCYENQLTSLDVSNNKALTSLWCNDNQLTSLDVSKNEALTVLQCQKNQLSSLDVSKNEALTKLWCNDNQLTSLDVSKNEALTDLRCNRNRLTSLDVSKNEALTYLECGNNQLTSMDVGENSESIRLFCESNEKRFCLTEKLTDLPGFDPAKASNWMGAAYDAESEMLTNVSRETVTYDYDCGNGYIKRFTLKLMEHADEDGNGFCDICGYDLKTGLTPEPDEPEEMTPIEAFVTRMYQVILEREPDAGSSTWINGLKDGSMTGVRVADGFVLSDEMLNKDISNEEFVKILYRAFFGREADEGGLATWKGLLDNGCKKNYVFAGFANSAEFGVLCAEAGIVQGRAAEYLADRQTGLSEADYKVWCFVERMYTEVLGRTADESGVRTWVGVLQDGSYTGVRVADGFLMSEEFLAKDMTNEEYVRIMYRAFFGRNADPEGLATWTNALATGWTKQRVFAGFANSNEFGVLCEQAGIVKGTAAEQ